MESQNCDRLPDAAAVAVKQNGRLLEFAAESCRSDREVVLAAVKNVKRSGQALQFAAESLRGDREVVQAA
eukprot:6473919-Amphidinium_carterae.1